MNKYPHDCFSLDAFLELVISCGLTVLLHAKKERVCSTAACGEVGGGIL
jgi:hypothetical protein